MTPVALALALSAPHPLPPVDAVVADPKKDVDAAAGSG
jgi:hypothetical protein